METTALQEKWDLEEEARNAEKELINAEKELVDAQHSVEQALRERNEARERLHAHKRKYELF